MRNLTWPFILLLSLALSSAPLAQRAPNPPLVFTGATVIDGTGAPPIPDAVVVIEGDRIRAVGPSASVTAPPGARVIDARGRTILPGLADLHTHLQGGWDGERGDFLNFGRYLDAFLYAGVTTIFDTGNSMPYVTQIKQEIAAGRLRGPRVYCTGPMIDSAEPIWPPLAEPMAGFAQAPRIVKRLVDNHVDMVKGYAGLSDLHIRALVEHARAAGLKTIVDTWERNGSLSLVRTGIFGFAHAPHSIPITPEMAREIAERKVAVVSTITVRESFANRRMQDLRFLDEPLIRDVMPAHFLDEIRAAARAGQFSQTGESQPLYRKWLDLVKVNVLQLWRAGALVAAGTDAPYPGVFQGEGIHRELELLVEAGLTPVEAIRAATRNAAVFLDGEGADWGTIAPGQRADLVVVSGRPHERIQDTRAIVDVIQAGRVLDRSALTVRPDEPAYRTSGSLMLPPIR